MTEKFTLPEIEDILESEGWDEGSISNLSRILTKPRVEFAEGEVVFNRYMENDVPTGQFVRLDNISELDEAMHGGNCRKLTTAEAGAGELVEALEEITRVNGHISHDIAQAALDKWKGDRDE